MAHLPPNLPPYRVATTQCRSKFQYRFSPFPKLCPKRDEDHVPWSFGLAVELYGGYVIVIMAGELSLSGNLGKLDGKFGA